MPPASTLQPLQLHTLVEPSPAPLVEPSKTAPYLPPSLVEPVPCTANCSGRGACHAGACYCFDGWAGASCAVPSPGCPGNCSGHGTCAAHQRQCVCDEFWRGVGCAEPVEGCPSGCSSAGRCVGGRCVCDDEHEGDDCSRPRPRCAGWPALCGGIEHGACGPAGACVCTTAWRGAACEIPVLPCPSGCGADAGRGACDHTAGRCACAAGWRGADCADRIPPLPGWAIALIATLTVVVLAAAALGGFVAYAMRVNKRRLRDVVAGRWRAVEEEGWKAEAVEGMMPGARFERYCG